MIANPGHYKGLYILFAPEFAETENRKILKNSNKNMGS